MKQFHFLYVHSTQLGYARMGTKIAEALEKQGVKVDDELSADHPDPKHLVCWASTPSHASGFFDGQRKVILTMWESMSLPESFRQAFHNFDQILVPSDQNVELFSRYHDNVVKIPLGVDSHDWAYRQRKPPTTDFRFLIGGSGTRKGLDLAYKAFRKVFQTWPSDMPRPVLQFKSPRPCEFVGERIEHIGGRITGEAERDLYGAAHCYLQPSRGEGWGLQPLQAIAQGLPTILTDAHGHSEFAYLGYGVKAGVSDADYFIYGDAGKWWEPDLDELCQYMEYVYYNYEEACRFAEMASGAAHRQFTWEKTAEKFVRAIGKSHFEAEYKGTRTWTTPDVKRYLVRVVKPWRAEIAGGEFQFLPGVDYWEVADVKRVLYEVGAVLDPSCVDTRDEDTGLTKAQLERFGDYSAAAQYCWTCHQKLGSGELQPVEEVAT